MRQLGKALSILLTAQAHEIALHEDVDAFYAPSECHSLVSRGEAARLRTARRHARAVAGMNVIKLAKRTVSAAALHRAEERVLANLVQRFTGGAR